MSALALRGLLRATLLAAALAAPGAFAREPVPAMGTLRPLTLPAKQEFRLDNGLQVTFVPFGTVPKVTLMLTVATGNVADGDKAGLADIVAQMLKLGAGKRDTASVARAAADMGGELEIGAAVEETTLGLDVLAEHSGDAIALLADVVQRAQLPAAELPSIQVGMKRNLAIARSQPQGIAGEAFARLMWGDSVYGRALPSDAQVDSVSYRDVTQFVAREFGAARAHLYVAGRFDAAGTEHAIRLAFSGWAAGAPRRHQTPRPAGGRVVQLIDRPGAKQSTILLGTSIPGPTVDGFLNLSVANALYGGTPLLSRLDQNLREDKGYTYGVGSHITPFRDIAGWALSADVNSADTAAALGEVFAELQRLRTTDAPVDELQRVQNYRAGTFLIGASSRQGLLGQLAFAAQQDLPDDWITHYVERVRAVTPAQARAAAAAALDPTRMVLVIVGDLAAIKPAVVALPALQGAEFR